MAISGSTSVPVSARSTRTWVPPANVRDATSRRQTLDAKIKQHKVNAKSAAKADVLKEFNFSEVNRDLNELKSILEYLEQATEDNQSSMYANKRVQFLCRVYGITVFVVWGGFVAYSTYQVFSGWFNGNSTQTGNSTYTGSSSQSDSSVSGTSYYFELIISVAMGSLQALNEKYRKKHSKVQKELEKHPLTPSQTIEIVRQGYKCMKHHARSTQPQPNSDLRPPQDVFAAPSTDLESQQISREGLADMYTYRYRKVPDVIKSHYMISPSYLAPRSGSQLQPMIEDEDDDDTDQSLSEVYPLDDHQLSDHQSQNTEDRDLVDD